MHKWLYHRGLGDYYLSFAFAAGTMLLGVGVAPGGEVICPPPCARVQLYISLVVLCRKEILRTGARENDCTAAG